MLQFIYTNSFLKKDGHQAFYRINIQRNKVKVIVVGWCEGPVYLTSLGRPTDIGLQLGKACYPCSG